MLELPYYDMDIVKPRNFQEIIVTNGYIFRSGIWLELPNGVQGFLMDPDDDLEILYWIPTPDLEGE